MKYVGDSIVFPKQRHDGSGFQIDIPQYHRAAVGIFPGTKLFLRPLPETRDLIVTPVEPEKWGDLWKLEVSLNDTPGAARSIVETLVQNNVNILIQEGLSDYAHNRGLAHRVVLVLDLADYCDDIDGDTHYRTVEEKPSISPNRLITAILGNAVGFLNPTPAEDKWDFSFKRMEFFYRNRRHRNGSGETHLIKKSIMVPDRVVYRDIYDSQEPSEVACHMISDTEEKYIKIRFLDPKTKYILTKIEHEERVGAILSFMNVLKKVDANIVNSYSRLTSMSRTAFWYAFSELPPEFEEKDVTGLLTELSRLEALESFTVLGHYGFPFDVARHAEDLELKNYQTPITKPKEEEEHDVGTSSASTQATEQRLGLRPFYAEKEWKPEPYSVFIAMPFDPQYEEFYRKCIRETIEGCGLHCVRIDQEDIPNPSIPIIDLIKRHIATCDFVVADVTGNNRNVVYEVGLAHAIGKRVLLLCEDRYKNEKGLLFDLRGYYHLFYSPYDTPNFTDRLRKGIEAMKDEG